MKKSKPKKAKIEPGGSDVPSWVSDDPPRGPGKRTEEEYDLLADGVIEGIKDTVAWKDLVRLAGQSEARRELRERLIAQDLLDTAVTWN